MYYLNLRRRQKLLICKFGLSVYLKSYRKCFYMKHSLNQSKRNKPGRRKSIKINKIILIQWFWFELSVVQHFSKKRFHWSTELHERQRKVINWKFMENVCTERNSLNYLKYSFMYAIHTGGNANLNTKHWFNDYRDMNINEY